MSEGQKILISCQEYLSKENSWKFVTIRREILFFGIRFIWKVWSKSKLRQRHFPKNIKVIIEQQLFSRTYVNRCLTESIFRSTYREASVKVLIHLFKKVSNKGLAELYIILVGYRVRSCLMVAQQVAYATIASYKSI